MACIFALKCKIHYRYEINPLKSSLFTPLFGTNPSILKTNIYCKSKLFRHYRAVACFLATCLTHLAYLGCAFLLVNGRNWQLHFLLSPIFCQSSKKAQPRYAKCVRQVARSKRQHGTCVQPHT